MKKVIKYVVKAVKSVINVVKKVVTSPYYILASATINALCGKFLGLEFTRNPIIHKDTAFCKIADWM